MILGQVTGEDEAVIEITLVDDEGNLKAVSFVVDTGFTGYLALPRHILHTLRSQQLADEDILLADGSRSRHPVYRVTIQWDGENQVAIAYAIDSRPLLGMKMLRGNVLTIEVEEGGEVTVEPI